MNSSNYQRFRDQEHGYHDGAGTNVFREPSTNARTTALSRNLASNRNDSTFPPSESVSQALHSSVTNADAINELDGSRIPSQENADSMVPSASISIHPSRPESLSNGREYLAMHKNLEQLDIGSSLLVATERKVQTMSHRQPSAKAAGKRRAVEEDNSNGKASTVLALNVADGICIRTKQRT
jgi:hypothetical protein